MSNAPAAVIILAAGEGTRMRSPVPKVLADAAGRALLGHVLDAAGKLKPAATVVVLSPRLASKEGEWADPIDALLTGAKARPAVQREPRGTADAVRAGLDALDRRSGTALILLGDAPLIEAGVLRKLLAAHRRGKARLSVLTITPPDPTGYGRLVRDERDRPVRIAEHRELAAAERRALIECNTGIWAADLGWLAGRVGAVGKKNRAGEFYLTDLFEQAAAEGRAQALHWEDPRVGLGVNTQADLARVAAILRERKNEELMAAGVTLVDPAGTWIDVQAGIGAGTRIEPGVRITGETRIGKGVLLSTGVVIESCRIADGVRILPHCVLSGSSVERGAQVGPLAHVRPGTSIGANARVGNFVELKKTKLARGAKANHLAYLGDADVGAAANVGAGTITCNYDGTRKYPTKIGAGAFIGSDTQLLAPVSVGKGAYVGAGSTITEDVPPGALALSRVPQNNVAGWAKRKAGGAKAKARSPKKKAGGKRAAGKKRKG